MAMKAKSWGLLLMAILLIVGGWVKLPFLETEVFSSTSTTSSHCGAMRKSGCCLRDMPGGCALNSVANGKLFSETPFRDTWIQPAAGDEGLAIGAALYTCCSILRQPRRYIMKNSYLGPEFSSSRIESDLKTANLRCRKM